MSSCHTGADHEMERERARTCVQPLRKLCQHSLHDQPSQRSVHLSISWPLRQVAATGSGGGTLFELDFRLILRLRCQQHLSTQLQAQCPGQFLLNAQEEHLYSGSCHARAFVSFAQLVLSLCWRCLKGKTADRGKTHSFEIECALKFLFFALFCIQKGEKTKQNTKPLRNLIICLSYRPVFNNNKKINKKRGSLRVFCLQNKCVFLSHRASKF